jgi:hypothetical protein
MHGMADWTQRAENVDPNDAELAMQELRRIRLQAMGNATGVEALGGERSVDYDARSIQSDLNYN